MSKLEDARREWKERKARGEVATDWLGEVATQPTARTEVATGSRLPVAKTIRNLLASADRAFTYPELATHVYANAQPTAAQLSAIRRAVAAMANRGEVQRTRSRTATVTKA